MNEVLLAWVIANCIGLIGVLLMLADSHHIRDMYLCNPFGVYDKIKVNWFGAWLIAIVVNVLLPCIAIPYWIYKLCTVGRR